MLEWQLKQQLGRAANYKVVQGVESKLKSWDSHFYFWPVIILIHQTYLHIHITTSLWVSVNMNFSKAFESNYFYPDSTYPEGMWSMTSYRCYTLIKALVEGARKQMIHLVAQIAAARIVVADQVCITYIHTSSVGNWVLLQLVMTSISVLLKMSQATGRRA